MSGPISAPPDPGRRRQALRLGLESLLGPMQVQAALTLWDEDYARSRSMALADYVGELSRQLGLDMHQRHALRIALYSSISRHDVKPGVTRAPRAAPTATVVVPPAAAISPPPTAAFVVFACMANEMRNAVQREGGGAEADFTRAVEQHALASRLHAEAGSLVRWSRGSADLQEFGTTGQDRLSLLMHAIYAAAAEALGPIAADRQLARASQLADALPEALKFSPRKLL